MAEVTIIEAMKIAHEHHIAGRLSEAETIYRQVLEVDPHNADAAHLLGVIAGQVGEFQIAIELVEAAVALRPDSAAYLNNLGEFYRSAGRTDEAIGALSRAVALRPNYAEAQNNLGLAYKDADRIDDAIGQFERASTLKPDYFAAQNNLGICRSITGRLDLAMEAFARCIALRPKLASPHSNLIYFSYFDPDVNINKLAALHEQWTQRHARDITPRDRHNNDRSPDRRLKVGYVSPDFYGQAEAFFVVPLLESHDPAQVEIFCYSSVRRADETTARLRRAAHVWRDCFALDDQQLADLIHEDGIDIVVDLTMHMAENRLLALATKPAPVQICWLAYPGSTGLPAIDYRITDRFLDPLDVQSPYVERSLYLPAGWFSYDPLINLPILRRAHDRPITFGSLNNPLKINDLTLRLWSPVLKEMRESRLLLMGASPNQKQEMRRRLSANGIEGDRVDFLDRCSRRDYLLAQSRIDIGLDPLPYNGITTTCDALWMGTPVASREGAIAAGRAGASILNTCGLGDLVADSDAEFARIAIDLANDRDRLFILQTGLRERFERSPLMGHKRFAREMESLYRTAWKAWVQEQILR